MRLIISSVFLGVALATYAVAAQPVASVTGSSSFDLNGNRVNVAGVPSWTVMSGDDIVAGASPLIVSFKDGSKITLAPDARLRIDSSAGNLSANLISGFMQYNLVSVRLLKGGVTVPERSGSGSAGVNPGINKPMLVKLPAPPNPVSGR